MVDPKPKPAPKSKTEAIDDRPAVPDLQGGERGRLRPVRRGKDPEYDWYRDNDHDGIVCELTMGSRLRTAEFVAANLRPLPPTDHIKQRTGTVLRRTLPGQQPTDRRRAGETIHWHVVDRSGRRPMSNAPTTGSRNATAISIGISRRHSSPSKPTTRPNRMALPVEQNGKGGLATPLGTLTAVADLRLGVGRHGAATANLRRGVGELKERWPPFPVGGPGADTRSCMATSHVHPLSVAGMRRLDLRSLRPSCAVTGTGLRGSR